MSYKIEKDIPLPRTGGGVQKYPFADMAIGDSFFVPVDDAKPESVRSSINHFRSKNKERKFRTSPIMDGEGKTTGIRIWRIA